MNGHAKASAAATTVTWARHLPPGVTTDDIDVVRGRSLTRAWAAQWRTGHERAVFRDAGSTHWTTTTTLEHRSRTIAGRLQRAGVRPGDRVLLSGDPSVQLIVAYCAILRAGAVVVPANTSYTWREVAHLIDDADPVLAIVEHDARRREISGSAACPVASLDVPLPDGVATNLDVADTDDPALICYTSGTTGVPKGAVLSHGNLLASAEAVRLAWRWTSDDELILALPLFHLHGLGVGVNGTLLAGARAVVHPRFDVHDVFRDVSNSTMFFGVPSMYSRLLDANLAHRLRSLRLCVSGSAPLPPAVHDAVVASSGQRILERYGMTETVMNVSHPYDGDRKPGTVGYPLPQVELRLAAGDVAEIQVRGPNVFSGYWRNPTATADSFTPDGWFRTGDVGELDDGQLRITGRTKELIISGGYNVYPREVEDVLRGAPGVADVAVVGVPSADWGETVVAFVVAEPHGVEVELLRGTAERGLAPYKRPKQYHVVETLPRNALGKVMRQNLRDIATALPS